MNLAPPQHEPQESVDLFAASRGLWRLLWRRQLVWRRLLGPAAALGGFTLLSWLVLANAPNDNVFYGWVVVFYFLMVMPLFCLNVCGAMIREEAAANTLCFFTTRPLKRSEMFLMFYFGHMVWLQIVFLIQTLLLFGIGILVGRDVLGFLPIFLVCQFFGLMSWGALCAMLGMLHARYVVLGLVYGLVVEVGIANIPTNLKYLSLSHHLRTLLVQHDGVNQVFGNTLSAEGWGWSLVGLGAGTILFLIAGAALFTWRELINAPAER